MRRRCRAGETAVFDHVIIGAGSAGCVLANRLSADPGTRVLLLEAGPADRSPWIHLPIGYYRTFQDPRVTWQFRTEPDPGAGNRRLVWPRGRVLGGSSSINGLVYVRGQRQDYDGWAARGNPGWSYSELLPFFRRAEGFREGADAWHGGEGPLSVARPRCRLPLVEAFLEAAQQAGIDRNPDYNGERQAGAAWFQLTLRGRWRCSAARAYLRPIRNRSNLRIETGAEVIAIRLREGRAQGVEYRLGERIRAVRARREVLLCAGAVQSPQLLMLSGIGPPEHLREVGIEPLHPLPGVGSNLQDHYQIRTVWRSPLPGSSLNRLAHSWTARLQAALQWALFGSGPLTLGAGVACLFWYSGPDRCRPDVQFHFIPFSAERPGARLHAFPGYTVSVCQLRPESRGTIRLRSADPRTAPRIQPNYLAAEVDRRVLVDGFRLLRRVMHQPAMDRFRAGEEIPGPICRSEADILAFARQSGGTLFHPTSTCAMGPREDSMAVVDGRLRVHGLRGLRVVDASIMPTLISGNTNAPVIAIAEKAAEMILEDARSNPHG